MTSTASVDAFAATLDSNCGAFRCQATRFATESDRASPLTSASAVKMAWAARRAPGAPQRQCRTLQGRESSAATTAAPQSVG